MTAPAISLDGKVALVSGGSRRIGRAICLTLAAAGAAVVVNASRSRAEAEALVAEIEAAGGRAMAAIADITDAAAVQAMVDQAVATFGRLDILVHNAAVRPPSRFETIGIEEWRRVVSIVLDGGFLLSQAAAPHLARGGEGAIVFIGGLTAHIGSDRVHVASAKAGLQGLTRSLAKVLGPSNVTVNTLVLGHIEDAGDDPEKMAGHRRMRPVESVALRRYGSPQDVANATLALAGPLMRYVSGESIHLNGGFYFG